MNDQIRLLITNDDGYFSQGIRELAIHCEQAGYDVTIAAPNYDASGVSASLGPITSSKPIPFTKPLVEGFGGNTYALDVPPATCVLLASLGAFGSAFDCVISGINNGNNAGRSVLHSGTVGAALAAQNFGMRGLAVSVGVSNPWYFESAAEMAVSLIPSLLSSPQRTAINLNVPGKPLNEVKGIYWAELAPFNRIRSVIEKLNEDSVKLKMEVSPVNWSAHADLALLANDCASLTSLQGSCEVWSDEVTAGQQFEESKPLPAVASGATVRPATAFLGQ